MSLTVGKDTYISVQDATAYVQSHYAHRADITTQWALLSETKIESMLRSSTRSIDTGFKFRGRKRHTSQLLQFPRYNSNFINFGFGINEPNQLMDTSLMDSAYDGTDGGFIAAAEATVENAIAGMLYAKDTETATQNSILGITSRKIGSIAESYGSAYGQNNRAAQFGIYAYEKVTHLLLGWVSGNFLSI